MQFIRTLFVALLCSPFCYSCYGELTVSAKDEMTVGTKPVDTQGSMQAITTHRSTSTRVQPVIDFALEHCSTSLISKALDAILTAKEAGHTPCTTCLAKLAFKQHNLSMLCKEHLDLIRNDMYGRSSIQYLLYAIFQYNDHETFTISNKQNLISRPEKPATLNSRLGLLIAEAFWNYRLQLTSGTYTVVTTTSRTKTLKPFERIFLCKPVAQRVLAIIANSCPGLVLGHSKTLEPPHKRRRIDAIRVNSSRSVLHSTL